MRVRNIIPLSANVVPMLKYHIRNITESLYFFFLSIITP
jgi:hypothetical protein